jgi:hypothetical protein
MSLIINNCKKKTCAVFIFDGFADQEISLTTAWLGGKGSEFNQWPAGDFHERDADNAPY